METFKDFFACKIVFDASHHYPENIQKLFRLQNFPWRKSSISWKYSKTFSPGNLSHPQIIIILKIFKDFFACKIVIFANHQNHGNIQRLFRLQNCLRRESSSSWKYSNLFRLQNCLSSKSSLSWNCSKTFSPANLSHPQIIIILKIFKDFFACKIVIFANHQNHGNIQRLFRLQNCLRRESSLSWKYSNLFRLQSCLSSKSSLSWKYSKTFSPGNLSHPQIFIVLKVFKNFFACEIASAANHHYPENIQRFFRLQNCLRRESSLSWKYSKTFLPAKLP